MRIDETLLIDLETFDIEVHQSDRKIRKYKKNHNAHTITLSFTTSRPLTEFEKTKLEERVQLDFNYFKSKKSEEANL